MGTVLDMRGVPILLTGTVMMKRQELMCLKLDGTRK